MSADQFRAFAASNGFDLPADIQPGKFIRFQTNGKRSDKAGWARLFSDGEGGIIGDWRTGIDYVWQMKRDRQFTPEEKRAWLAKIEQQRLEAQAQREREEDEAAIKAKAIWEKAPPVESHPYLAKKGIKAHGLRLQTQEPYKGSLIVPVYDVDKGIRSLQFISPEGEKFFLSGGRVHGGYFALKGDVPACICEGFATAASVHEATGRAVAIAFNAGNLLSAAQALRAKRPGVTFVLCADNDVGSDVNTGVKAATEAARAIGGLLAVCPSIDGKTDFNDLASARGAEAIKAAIQAAKAVPPVSTTPQKSNSGDPGGPELVTRCFADIKPEPVNWLWPDQIARGKLTVIAGDPGLGKSQITASLAAIVSTGGHWPVDRTPCEKGRVVFLSAEDDVSDTIRPRLDAAGADVSLCHVVERVKAQARDGSGPIKRAFNLKADMELLSRMLAELGDVALVIIDPVSAYMGDTDTHRNADVRAVLAEVSEVAGKHKSAFVVCSHLNKGESEKALQRVTGSLAFVAAARAAFLVAQDPQDEEKKRRLFVPMKNNIGPDSTGYAYRIEAVEFPGIKTSRITWSGDRVTITADEALTSEGAEHERSALDAAKEFLEVELSGGTVPTKQIQKDAEDAGLKWATVRRAKTALCLKVTKAGMDAPWTWELPATNDTKMLKSAEDAQAKVMSTFERNEHLREPESPVAESGAVDKSEGERL